MRKIILENILNGNIDLIKQVDMFEWSEPKAKVTVFPKHLKSMLLSYLKNKINEEQINDWAEFLCFRDEYTCINSDSDESADFYEVMWYVVQKLSTPEIDGEITPETVKMYLKELDKYF